VAVSLTGKVAIITGAARGQGEAEARLFHDAGAAVVLTDMNEAGSAVAENLGSRALFLKHDVGDQGDWADVVGAAENRFGRIDVLVNNAGITGYESLQAITREQMERYMAVHFYGALFGIQAVYDVMKRTGGAIVNVASTAALRGHPGYVGYGASKWALRGLGRYAAHDLVKHGIRINTILPGGVDTPMLRRPDADSLVSAARAAVPMERFAHPSEIAQAALFLATDASSYMTGAELVVDGGLTA
jgi:3alpha(or 20beta)-hydroxysteroid dehydrogenase